MIVSLWNLAGVSAALLPMCLPNFRAIGKVNGGLVVCAAKLSKGIFHTEQQLCGKVPHGSPSSTYTLLILEIISNMFIEMKMSFWRNFCHWLHRKEILPMQEWRKFRQNVNEDTSVSVLYEYSTQKTQHTAPSSHIAFFIRIIKTLHINHVDENPEMWAAQNLSSTCLSEWNRDTKELLWKIMFALQQCNGFKNFKNFDNVVQTRTNIIWRNKLVLTIPSTAFHDANRVYSWRTITKVETNPGQNISHSLDRLELTSANFRCGASDGTIKWPKAAWMRFTVLGWWLRYWLNTIDMKRKIVELPKKKVVLATILYI